MNILVTGGAGFIGSHLVWKLVSEPEVGCLVNLDCLTYAGCRKSLDGLESLKHYHFEQVDLRDKQSVFKVIKHYGISHVMHLAAESHVDRSIVGPDDFITTNVIGTFNLLEACRHGWTSSTGRKFLNVSTDEVYGSLGGEGFFNEASPYQPNSPYSASKAGGDLLARSYYSTYGLPVVTTHCSNNFGPRQFPEKLIPVVLTRLMARKRIPVYGDGKNIRDWLHVEDHVNALWLVLVNGKPGEVYDIGADNEWNNVDLVGEICRLFDRNHPQFGGDSERLIEFVTDRPGHDRRYAIDSSKIKTELGWTPKVSFKQGLEDTIRWYVENPEWVAAANSNLIGA